MTTAPDEPVFGERTFDRELEAMEADVADLAARARSLMASTTARLDGTEAPDADAVDRADDEVDARYVAVERQAVLLIARRQPVAGDLRRILALLRTGLHLERIADGAVDVARFLADDGPVSSPDLVEALQDMVRTTVSMTELALRSLTTQDIDLALEVERMDDHLDRRQAEVFQLLVATSPDDREVASLLATDRIARSLERAGDHAVDIAEEAWFLATGEPREFGRPHRID